MAKTDKIKIACILSLEGTEWVSCKSIVPNIFKLYQKSFPDAKIAAFNYAEGTDEYNYYLTVNKILEFSPDRIVICDHKPHPAKILKDLFKNMGEEKMPPVYCHLFGDFSIYAASWLEIEYELKSMKIRFIAASHRQAGFFSQFVNSGDDFISCLPFPVDDKKYRFSQKERGEARKRLFAPGDKKTKFLYTGRMSAQKNIVALIRCFKDFLTLSGSEASLYIAGFFDDLAYPFFGLYYPKECNRYAFFEELNSYDDSIKERIHFLGDLSSGELCEYYLGCDVFVSISLHNDEDYGMSPAEAQCCGMPLILSNWGGYASFAWPEAPTSLVKVSLQDSFYRVHYDHFIKLLMKYDMMVAKDSDRRKVSISSRNLFGLSGVVEQLRYIYSLPVKNFSSWNKKFKFFSNCFVRNPSNPFGIRRSVENFDESEENNDYRLEEGIRSRIIYRECYAEYVDNI